jgi:hypothetical protein
MSMQAVVEIPSPTPRDSETVVTALETAAVFRAKGDAAEALRWLQRAAESAGDDGDDERTLALARTAADLSRALQQPGFSAIAHDASDQHTPTHSRRLPKPPLRSSARPDGDEADPPQSLTRPSHTPSPPTHGPLNHRPPPPSSRPAPPSVSRAYDTTSASSAPASTRPLPSFSSRPAPAQARAASSPIAAQTRIEMRASDAAALTDTDADLDGQRLTQPIPVPSHFAEASGGARLRQAARVSVVASADEPGLFLVRLLDDGSAPPAGAAEALMVLVDPSSTVFSH